MLAGKVASIVNCVERIIRSLAVGVSLTAAVAAAQPLPTEPSLGEHPTPAPGQAPATPALPAAKLSTAESSALRARCDDVVAAVLKGSADAAALQGGEAAPMLKKSPDLVNCAAIAADSRAVCQVFNAQGKGEQMKSEFKDCVVMWSVFHEARNYPKGHSYFFGEAMVDDCKIAKPAGAQCDEFIAALRSGDSEACAKAGTLAPLCRAYLALDPSLCQAPPGLDGLDEDCRREIAEKAPFAKGLKEVAASGTGRQRAFAKAAMGDRRACDEFAKPAKEACVAAGQPTPAAPLPPTMPAENPTAPAEAPTPNPGVG